MLLLLLLFRNCGPLTRIAPGLNGFPPCGVATRPPEGRALVDGSSAVVVTFHKKGQRLRLWVACRSGNDGTDDDASPSSLRGRLRPVPSPSRWWWQLAAPPTSPCSSCRFGCGDDDLLDACSGFPSSFPWVSTKAALNGMLRSGSGEPPAVVVVEVSSQAAVAVGLALVFPPSCPSSPGDTVVAIPS